MCFPPTAAAGPAAGAAAGASAMSTAFPPAMLGLSIASSLGGLYAQRQEADAANKYNAEMGANINRTYGENLSQINLEATQQAAQASQAITQGDLNEQKAAAQTQVGADASGIGGTSVQAALADLAGKNSRYTGSVMTNYDNRTGALNNQEQNLQANATSQVDSLKSPVSPNYLQSGLQIGNSIFGFNHPGGS